MARSKPLDRLKRRSDFRAASAGARCSASGFTLQARPRTEDGAAEGGAARVGFTVSKQVGNAVERNRVRRRLREVVRLAAAGAMRGGHDYVLVGRRAALALPFGDMQKDLEAALRRVHATESGRGGTGDRPVRTLHESGCHEAGSVRRKPRN